MDFSVTFIDIIPGKLEEAKKELSKIFGRGSGGKRGEHRWDVYQEEPTWYDPLATVPCILIYAFEFETKDIIRFLKKQGLAV